MEDALTYHGDEAQQQQEQQQPQQSLQEDDSGEGVLEAPTSTSGTPASVEDGVEANSGMTASSSRRIEDDESNQDDDDDDDENSPERDTKLSAQEQATGTNRKNSPTTVAERNETRSGPVVAPAIVSDPMNDDDDDMDWDAHTLLEQDDSQQQKQVNQVEVYDRGSPCCRAVKTGTAAAVHDGTAVHVVGHTDAVSSSLPKTGQFLPEKDPPINLLNTTVVSLPMAEEEEEGPLQVPSELVHDGTTGHKKKTMVDDSAAAQQQQRRHLVLSSTSVASAASIESSTEKKEDQDNNKRAAVVVTDQEEGNDGLFASYKTMNLVEFVESQKKEMELLAATKRHKSDDGDNAYHDDSVDNKGDSKPVAIPAIRTSNHSTGLRQMAEEGIRLDKSRFVAVTWNGQVSSVAETETFIRTQPSQGSTYTLDPDNSQCTTRSQRQDIDGTDLNDHDAEHDAVEQGKHMDPRPGAFSVHGRISRHRSEPSSSGSLSESEPTDCWQEEPVLVESHQEEFLVTAEVVDEEDEQRRILDAAQQHLISTATYASVVDPAALRRRRLRWMVAGMVGLVAVAVGSLLAGLYVPRSGTSLYSTGAPTSEPTRSVAPSLQPSWMPSLSPTQYFDHCGAARYINTSSLPFSISRGQTTEMSSELGDHNPSAVCSLVIGINRGVWYQLEGNGRCLSASVLSKDFDVIMAIYQGTCRELGCVAQTDGNKVTSAVREVTWMTQKRASYYLLITGGLASTGTFTLSLTDLGRACNDDCSTPLVLNRIPVLLNGSTDSASVVDGSSGAFTCSLLDGSVGRWYQVLGSGSCLSASTVGSGFDTVLAVYNGSCGNLQCVTANDNANANLTSHVYFPTSSGRLYHVLVAGVPLARGELQLNITDVANNWCDASCPEATSIRSLPYSEVGSVGVLDVYFDAVDCGPIDPLRWARLYSIQGNDKCMHVSASDSDIFPWLAVGSGTCSSFSCKDYGWDKSSYEFGVYWFAEKNAAYTVALQQDDGVFYSGKDYILNVTEIDCDRLPCINATWRKVPFDERVDGDAVGLSRYGNYTNLYPCLSTDPDAHGLWYKFVSPSNESCITVALSADSLDDAFVVVSAGDCSPQMLCVTDKKITNFTFPADADPFTIYLVFVGGLGNATGDYHLSVTAQTCPQNADFGVDLVACQNATVIERLPYTNRFNDTDSVQFWYTFAGRGSCVKGSFGGGGVSTFYYLSVYSGECDGLLDYSLQLSDNSEWYAQDGTKYFISLSMAQILRRMSQVANTTQMAFSLEEVDCADREGCFNANHVDVLYGSSIQDFENFHVAQYFGTVDNSSSFSGVLACPLIRQNWLGVWYTLDNFDGNSCVDISTTGSLLDTVVGVYHGSSCEGHLACVAENDNASAFVRSSEVSVSLGTYSDSYYVFVGGARNTTGNYTVSFNFTSDPCAPMLH